MKRWKKSETFTEVLYSVREESLKESDEKGK